MNQAMLCLLGLTAVLAMCSSAPYGRRVHNWSEVFGPTPANSEGTIPASEQLEKRSQHNWSEVFGPSTASPPVDDKETKAVYFQECRKMKQSGITAKCEDDEIAVGCAGTGVHSCSVTQMFGARGCTVDKESCGHDVVRASYENAIINVVCCKTNAVAVE